MTEPLTVDGLTDTETATRRLRAAGLELSKAEPMYIRHKPGQTTVIAYRFTLADSETWGYARWCTDPDRAREIYVKATCMRPRPSLIGRGLTRLDPHTVLYAFPNDARLRALRWYTQPRKLKRSLEPLAWPDERISGRRTSVEILRYKPERRVVAKVTFTTTQLGTRPVLVRYSTQRQAHKLAAIASHLRRHGVDTPAPILQLDGGRVAIDDFIVGRQLRDVVQLTGADGASLGAALRRLHMTPPLPCLGRRTAMTDLAKTREGLRGLASLRPSLGTAVAALAEQLTRSLPITNAADVVLHGDLHAKNILVAGDGVAFVDLERVAVGPAAIDLGYFKAHAIALAIRQPGWSPTALDHAEAMIEHYRAATDPIASATLGWHTAIGLIDQALLVTRHLEHRWQKTSAQLLDAADTQLRNRTIASGIPR